MTFLIGYVSLSFGDAICYLHQPNEVIFQRLSLLIEAFEYHFDGTKRVGDVLGYQCSRMGEGM